MRFITTIETHLRQIGSGIRLNAAGLVPYLQTHLVNPLLLVSSPSYGDVSSVTEEVFTAVSLCVFSTYSNALHIDETKKDF